VQKFRQYVLALLLLFTCWPTLLEAQILDDSTTLVYGPRTTNYIKEADLLYHTNRIYHPDTLLNNFHRFTEPEILGYRYQNLGNLGTALGPIFYEAPEVVGERTGYYVYDHWFNAPEDIRYYNTRSPYTDLQYFLAGNGRSWVDVTHSRNVTPNWNVGFDFRRLTSDKQIGPTRRRDDKQVVSTAYDLFTYYHTKDRRYHLMANFSRLKHSVEESGGIAVPVIPEDITDIIRYEESPIRLQNAESQLLRINYHIYQQYKLSELGGVYHRLTRQTESNEYLDSPLSTDIGYYNQALISTDSTTDRLHQQSWQNELGLKGELSNLYYRLYYKRRDIRYEPHYLPPVQESEDYTGFSLRLAADSSLMVSAEGEYLWGGFYKASAFVRFKWLEVSLRRTLYKPAFMQENYFGNHDEWYNEFEAPAANELKASVNLPLGRLQFKGGVQVSVVERHIYFTGNIVDSLAGTKRRVNVRPQQADAAAQILSPFAFVRWEFAPNLFWENEITYTQVSGKAESVFNIPTWLYNGSVYFEGEMFGGNLYGQLGLDAHWKSSYYANAYDPVTRQYLVQNDFLVQAYPIIDVFFGFRIARTRVFVRMSHLNQGLPAEGYFLTPYYSGTGRTFDLGIDWLFFD
jgi:hypothetical protein